MSLAFSGFLQFSINGSKHILFKKWCIDAVAIALSSLLACQVTLDFSLTLHQLSLL